MNPFTSFGRILVPGLFALLAALACGGTQPEGPPGESPASLDLRDPAESLTSLDSYQAQVVLRFTGMQDGHPLSWEQTWSIARGSDPPGTLITLSRLDENGTLVDAWLEGEIGGVGYSRAGPEFPCSAWALTEGESAGLETGDFTPLDYLPPVSAAMRDGAPETLEGVSAVHYTFDENAVDAVGVAEAVGDLWVSADGGFPLKYVLQADGGAAYFGEGIEGTMTWEFELSLPNQVAAIPLPDDCPLGLVDLPMLTNASEVVSQPGFTGYLTSSGPEDVAAFYEEALSAEGWEAIGESIVSDAGARLQFSNADRLLTISVGASGDGWSVWLGMERTATPAPATTAVGTGEDQSIVEASLYRLLGSGPDGSPVSVLPSYHLEASGSDPQWDASLGRVVDAAYDLRADVAGADLHLVLMNRRTDGEPMTLEGYLVGGTEYELVGGAAQPGFGNVVASWALWPQDVGPALAFAALGVTPAGEEVIDGRTARVFELNSDLAPDGVREPVQDLTGYQSSLGTVWIDVETGALLRLRLDYVVEITDPSTGASAGPAAGHAELEVAGVGGTTVEVP